MFHHNNVEIVCVSSEYNFHTDKLDCMFTEYVAGKIIVGEQELWVGNYLFL